MSASQRILSVRGGRPADKKTGWKTFYISLWTVERCIKAIPALSPRIHSVDRDGVKSFERLLRSRGSATLPGIATRLFKSQLGIVAETPAPHSK
jgi:hypothetical protein